MPFNREKFSLAGGVGGDDDDSRSILLPEFPENGLGTLRLLPITTQCILNQQVEIKSMQMVIKSHSTALGSKIENCKVSYNEIE